MASFASFIVEIIGLIMLIAGYRRSYRNLMLAAALVLWAGASFNEFSRGFMDGWTNGFVHGSMDSGGVTPR